MNNKMTFCTSYGNKNHSNNIIKQERYNKMDKYLSNAKNMLDFIKKSPSCYHVIDNFKTMLDNKGFCELITLTEAGKKILPEAKQIMEY